MYHFRILIMAKKSAAAKPTKPVVKAKVKKGARRAPPPRQTSPTYAGPAGPYLKNTDAGERL